MRSLVLWLSRWFISDHENTADIDVRNRYGLFAGWLSILVNLALFAAKIILGFLSGSISLIADAFHTLLDAVTSVVVVVSFSIMRKPSDDRHPYGHGRAEYIGALILALLLIVMGIEFFRSSFYRIFVPKKLDITYLAIAVVTLTLIVKELLGRFTNVIAQLIDSDALKADSWHHRSDAISSIFVIAAMVAGRFGAYWLDGVMGIAVAAIIAFLGVKIFKDAADRLLGDRPSKELLKSIYTTAKSVEGVLDIHDISVHSYGPTKMISLHAQVEDSISATQAHMIAEKIENKMNAQINSTRTVVHIDPQKVSSPLVDRIVREIKSFRNENPRIVSFHDVRIRGDGNNKVIEVDLAISKGTSREIAEQLKSGLSSRLAEKFPGYTTRIDIDPDYFYQKPK